MNNDVLFLNIHLEVVEGNLSDNSMKDIAILIYIGDIEALRIAGPRPGTNRENFAHKLIGYLLEELKLTIRIRSYNK